MPPITADLLACVFYLYESEDAARRGEKFGGAGFLVSVTNEEGVEFRYAVSNQHVIGKGFSTIRFNTSAGDVEILETSPDDWTPHPQGDDVSVMPFGITSDHLSVSTIPAASFVVEGQHYGPGWLAMGPGDDVFVVSRFITHDGKQRNQPAVRFGHIAMMPGEPIQTQWGVKQSAFLVEVLSLSGASGSPVFVYRMPYGAVLGGTEMQQVQNPRLLGIDFSHISIWRDVKLDDRRTSYIDPASGEKLYVEQNSGMMGVVPAWKLMECLESKELVALRDKIQEEIAEQSEHVTLDVEDSEGSELARFEELARKIVHVPKIELDEKLKGES